jgi:predicted permease
MTSFWQDVRYGLRTIAKAPGFAAIVILTLALGIGANTALFSVVNGVLLKPLPFSDFDRIIALFERRVQFERASISYPNFLDWQRENHSFEALAAYRSDDLSLTGRGETEKVHADMVSADFFSVLGVAPVLGRDFSRDEDRRGAAPVAIISNAFWRRKFDAAPSILDNRVALDGTDYTIIGVLPPSFHLAMWNFQDSDVFVPVGQWNDVLLYDRNVAMGMDAIGRLKPGVTLEQARADMAAITDSLAASYPQSNVGVGATLLPLKESMVREIKPFLLVLFAAVGFVLLIACVNVANLLLARSTVRAREFSIRAALGASQARVIRQLLTESALLSVIGGGLGLLVSAWGTQAAVSLLPHQLPRAEQIGFDGRVFLFTAAISIASGILFGLAPARRTSQPNLQTSLQEGGRGSSGARHRAHGIFVATEMAMAVVLLVGAGLMIRSLAQLWRVDPGFNPHHLATFEVGLSPSMGAQPPQAIRATLLQLHDTIASVPGVESASLLRGALPMWSDSDDPFWIEGKPKPLADSDKPWGLWYEVEPDYLSAMGIPLKRGRFITPEDTERSRRVTVIDEDLAEKYFPGEDPIGEYLVDDYVGPAEIIGVVGHVKQWGLEDKLENGQTMHAEFYIPFRQIPDAYMSRAAREVTVVVRTKGQPLAVIETIRQAIAKMNSDQVLFESKPYDQLVANSIAAQRFSMVLLGTFAAMALLLSSVGIYGVISFLVGQRTHEIGVRIALGAQRADILRMVLGRGANMALVGVMAGLIGALGLTRLMSSLLFGISATDPVTFAGVAILLTVVALAACYVPARRAMRVDPIVALRYE